MTEDDLPPFMTVLQVSRVLQLGRSKTYELTVEWEHTGGESGIPFVWFGRQKRVPRAALLRFIDAQMQGPPAA